MPYEWYWHLLIYAKLSKALCFGKFGWSAEGQMAKMVSLNLWKPEHLNQVTDRMGKRVPALLMGISFPLTKAWGWSLWAALALVTTVGIVVWKLHLVGKAEQNCVCRDCFLCCRQKFLKNHLFQEEREFWFSKHVMQNTFSENWIEICIHKGSWNLYNSGKQS